jgi:serine-type D-Ala-D-Ala carboxypeptidase (penicillin-binding protein 5/6)
MPYSLFQGGRRRRRSKGPAIAAIMAMLAGFLSVVLWLGRDHDAARPRQAAKPTPTAGASLPLDDSGTAPLAGGGTAPSPLAVRLDDPRDAVSIRFKKAPRSGLLFDLDTGRVLWRRDPTRVLPIASLTKMMTALIVADRIPRGHKVRVTKQALAYKGSAVGILPKGKWIGVETMLHGLLLPSGNDAAIALAQRAARTVPRFVRLMNARAHTMGLTCTRYSSPDGFEDKGNHSCAADLAAIARQLLRTPRLARIVRRRSAELPFPIKGGRIYLYNNNPLLRSGYPGTTGVKTGYTDAAGRCLVASARRGTVRLGVVLLASPDPGKQARQLLDRGFRVLKY